MKINELVTEAHEMAKSKGWHETPRTPLEFHMLIVTEIAEASEEVRKGAHPSYLLYDKGRSVKPCGELIELADAVIRIADYAGSNGWDLEEAIRLKMEYNATRPHRHGGKLA